MSPEHRKTGARFDRFGVITTHVDGNGQQVYFDDLTYLVAGREAAIPETPPAAPR